VPNEAIDQGIGLIQMSRAPKHVDEHRLDPKSAPIRLRVVDRDEQIRGLFAAAGNGRAI